MGIFSFDDGCWGGKIEGLESLVLLTVWVNLPSQGGLINQDIETI
ncbi:hypothetical protein SAMN04488002_1148 [Litoreibacter janthinus]|uniref:Uncharacterized protein n=1 Tax=Litoreibacter janthinus TaxID=670154 RepID=A0A1I6GAH8_9RHOB|nr:hypothetical protein SAMN04488002_1148 [Litoreibacter janthinus]